MKFFITFGSAHLDKNGNKLSKAFVVIEAPTEDEARDIMLQNRGQAWAFMYTEPEFAGQIEKYGLHQVELEDI